MLGVNPRAATRFSRGDSVVWRIIWHGRVWWAVPVTVVADRCDLVALYVAPGTPFKAGEVLKGDPALPTTWRLIDRPWVNHILQLTKPGEAHSIWAVWPPDCDALAYWYVNLQEPLERTEIGFDTRDNMLDIVVEPDLSAWRWKDEVDVANAVEARILSREEAAEIRREGERVVELIERGTPPFDPTWATWRPDPAWPIPALGSGWDEVGDRFANRFVNPS